MDIVTDFESLLKLSNQWKPSMIEVGTIEEAADYINFPHEDYPEFVDSTLSTLKEVRKWIPQGDINERDVKHIHQMCMKDKEYLPLGKYRGVDVIVGGHLKPPTPYLIASMMMSIFPVGLNSNFNTTESVFEWYKIFETIHPFEDGNGRVGGIILSSFTSFINGKFLVPKREYSFFIDPIIKRLSDINDTLINNSKYFDQNLSFEDRSILYLESKIKGLKFQKILEETNNIEEINMLIDHKDVVEILKLLTKISKL